MGEVEAIAKPRELLEAIGDLVMAIAPHHMGQGQRRQIAAALSVLVDHIIALAAMQEQTNAN